MSGSEAAETADVVVVGGGGSGLAAALTAAREGSKVLLLEKQPKLGGTTARSVGSISASGTRLQRLAGIADIPEQHAEDMALFAGPLAARDNLELRRLFTENVPETVHWLESLGLVFFGPMPEPPHRVPRMHNVLPNSRAYLYQLSRAAERAGVRFLLGARATRLLTEAGRVVGVEATRAGGETLRVGARRAVILAAGDYSSGREFKEHYLAPEIARIEGINDACTGDGQRLALELGAEVVNGDVIYGPEIRFPPPGKTKFIARIPPTRAFAQLTKFALAYAPSFLLRPFLMSFVTTHLAPSHKLFQEGAILVNREGRRFVDERDRPQLAIPQQPGGIAYIVFDHTVAEKFRAWPYFISTAPGLAYAYLPDYRRHRRDIYAEANTIEELAAKIGVPAAVLAETIADCNRARPAETAPLATPPFVALGPAKSWIVMADGGLKVDTDLRVLGRDGKPIAGLYAAGSTGQGGLILEGHGHHLGWAFTSGRIAGRNAARTEPTETSGGERAAAKLRAGTPAHSH